MLLPSVQNNKMIKERVSYDFNETKSDNHCLNFLNITNSRGILVYNQLLWLLNLNLEEDPTQEAI